jgi:hypothetical protein
VIPGLVDAVAVGVINICRDDGGTVVHEDGGDAVFGVVLIAVGAIAAKIPGEIEGGWRMP